MSIETFTSGNRVHDAQTNGAGPTTFNQTNDIIKLAILAVGGQGGAVLTNWILDVAESSGYTAQSTSVPGVAQRTGATIYYVEMLPQSDRQPVFALMPAPGDVDIVVAAELMEAGRAVTRGLVTPDRTTLVASSHRLHAVSEKVVPGDGIVRGAPVLEAVSSSAKEMICHDLAAVADRHGAHISASLFGALAGSGALPFSCEQFEATIRRSGRGVEASLKAFGAAFDLAANTTAHQAATETTSRKGATGHFLPVNGERAHPELISHWQTLSARIRDVPASVQAMARAGLSKVVDYQDLDYGGEYLALVRDAAAKDRQHGGEAHEFAFTIALAKHLANAMCYDDVIRVADLKTRSSRSQRVRQDIGATDDTVVKVTEYMHPRAAEIIATMPTALGRYIERRRWLVNLIEGRCRKGHRLRSDATFPFMMLYTLAGLRYWRRKLLRHEREVAHRDAWLAKATKYLDSNYPLAVEVLNARRLIKGYGDTHARGHSKFDRVIAGIALVDQRDDAADWARRLIAAALEKADGSTLDGALDTIRSFAAEEPSALANVETGREPAATAPPTA